MHTRVAPTLPLMPATVMKARQRKGYRTPFPLKSQWVPHDARDQEERVPDTVSPPTFPPRGRIIRCEGRAQATVNRVRTAAGTSLVVRSKCVLCILNAFIHLCPKSQDSLLQGEGSVFFLLEFIKGLGVNDQLLTAHVDFRGMQECKGI